METPQAVFLHGEFEVAPRDIKSGFGMGEKQCWTLLSVVAFAPWSVWVYAVLLLAAYRAWGLLHGPPVPTSLAARRETLVVSPPSDDNLAPPCGGEPKSLDIVNTGWLQWSNPTITGIEVVGGSCTISLTLESDGGSWAFLDEVMFVRER